MTNISLNETMSDVTTTSFNSTIETMSSNMSSVPTFIFLEVPFTTGPLLDIFIISLIAALFTTLLNKYLTDQVTIKALRVEMKKKQKEMREMLKKNPQKAQAMQSDLMKKNMEIFKHSFNIKILVITLIPLLYIFTQIRAGYIHYDVILNLGFVSFGWLGSYIILTIICSIALKKILNVA
ncbi:MAG: hypothetical protein LAT82_00495 [Nanoarchaeota archaeon]|nr:hypothetical protein [Nanoarchaeota archaeon]